MINENRVDKDIIIKNLENIANKLNVNNDYIWSSNNIIMKSGSMYSLNCEYIDEPLFGVFESRSIVARLGIHIPANSKYPIQYFLELYKEEKIEPVYKDIDSFNVGFDMLLSYVLEGGYKNELKHQWF